MLKWLAGGKVDHPMADAKQARELIADLPTNDPLKLLEDLAYWLESLNHTDGFKVSRRFENVELLDLAAKTATRKLLQDYLGTSRQQKFQENRLWTVLFNFWRELGTGYLRCLTDQDGGTTTATAIRKSLPMLVCRCLRALTMQLKLSLLRYGPTEARVWEELGRVWQVVEGAGLQTAEVVPYPGPNVVATSLQTEFLKPLMLSAAATSGLTPVRQDIAERLIHYVAASFKLEKGHSPTCNHVFDIAGGNTPARVIGPPAASATARYFGAGDSLARLNVLRGSIVETGAFPPDLQLLAQYDKQAVVGVLTHLQLHWSENPPARSAERRNMPTRITVVPGLAGLVDVLNNLKGDSALISAGSAAESWIVENVSDGGYGAVISAAKSDWIRVGTLIGVKTDAAPYWGVGIIRRVTRDENQQRRVGIQMITRTAIPIRLSQAGRTAGFDDAPEETEIGVLMATAPDKQGEVGVVMREAAFNSRDSLDMAVNGKYFLLMPGRLVEGGEDFDWAKFKIMQRSSGAE